LSKSIAAERGELRASPLLLNGNLANYGNARADTASAATATAAG